LGGTPVDLTSPDKTSDELPRQSEHEDMDEEMADAMDDDLHKEGAVAS
jgi:hypothetical protein